MDAQACSANLEFADIVFMFNFFTESPKMEFYGPEDIKKAQKSMKVDFEKATVDPRNMSWSTANEVWKEGQKKTFTDILKGILWDINLESHPSVSVYSKLKNLSIRMGRDIVCVGKKVSGAPGAQASGHLYPSDPAGRTPMLIVVVGAGAVFAAAKTYFRQNY